MNKKFILACASSLLLSLTAMTGCSEGKENTITLGRYPQAKVSDDTLISALNAKAGTLPTETDTYKWTDYGYYIDGEASSYMYYIDVDQDNDGSYDYRGVYFTEYRSYWTSESDSDGEEQSTNGYSTNTVYWFEYNPITWKVLTTSDDNKALVLTSLILDAQDYNYTNEERSDVKDYQGNTSTSTVYANNYMYSHIRSWLNDTFYETAFSTAEKQRIETTTVDNSASSTNDDSNEYACSDTKDKMFLLSNKEAETYCSSDSKRIAQGTDYAKSQGLWVYTKNRNNGNSCYWFRSPNEENSYYANVVGFDGGIYSNYGVDDTDFGVRAACWIQLEK
jgi:hypothetical protein